MKWMISVFALFLIGLTSTASAETAPMEVKVTIDGFEYKPDNVTVKKGGKVTFTNLDSAPHNVAPEKDAHFKKSERMLQNERQTVTFDEVGDQHYLCDIHPSMKGVVKVVE